MTWELKSAESFQIVPETCDPTCTVVTALIVPVASTTCLISPRSVAAVKYCGACLRFMANAAKITTPIATIARMNHLFFMIFNLSPLNRARPARSDCTQRSQILKRHLTREVAIKSAVAP